MKIGHNPCRALKVMWHVDCVCLQHHAGTRHADRPQSARRTRVGFKWFAPVDAAALICFLYAMNEPKANVCGLMLKTLKRFMRSHDDLARGQSLLGTFIQPMVICWRRPTLSPIAR
jgi:hypothetical protein